MARPKKNEEDKKNKVIKVRMTDEEMRMLSSLASVTKMTKSGVLRGLCNAAYENLVVNGAQKLEGVNRCTKT